MPTDGLQQQRNRFAMISLSSDLAAIDKPERVGNELIQSVNCEGYFEEGAENDLHLVTRGAGLPSVQLRCFSQVLGHHRWTMGTDVRGKTVIACS